MAGKHFRDERLSMKGIPPKLRAITDKYLESKGIDQRIEPISILDKDFERNVGKRTRTKTKAAEIEHAIRHHLDVELNDDPDLQASFAEALAKIFQDFHNNWEKIYEELEKLRECIKSASKEPTYGLHRKKQMPFFRSFKREISGLTENNPVQLGMVAEPRAAYGLTEEEKISILVDLTNKVFLVVESELGLAGFWESIPARNNLKAKIQNDILLQPPFVYIENIKDKKDQIISRVMEIAEKNNDVILYAE